MRRVALILLALVVSAQVMWAQAAFNPIEYEEYKLDNGLTVILHLDRTAPTAMTYCLYKVGSKDEQPGLTGFAHFFEHLMFEGTENIERGSIDKLVTGAGGVLNASTSFDQTDYFFKVPINQLELALWIESERMMNLVVDSIGIETQRGVVKEELKQRYEGKPYSTLSDNLFKTTFKGTQYEWTPIGQAQHINNAKYEEFMAFHRKFYLPNNACLVVAGDLDVDQTKEWVQKYFGPIEEGPDPARIPVKIPEQTQPREVTIEEETTPLPGVIHSYVTVESTHPDAYALSLLGNIFSSGQSSRLYRRLVDSDQIALQASSFPFSLEKTGMFAFFAIATQGSDIPTLEAAMEDELKKLQENGVTEEEFTKARNQFEASFARRLSGLSGKARQLAYYSLFEGDTDLINTELEKYMAVTRDDIKRVAKKYLQPNRRNTINYVVVDKAN